MASPLRATLVLLALVAAAGAGVLGSSSVRRVAGGRHEHGAQLSPKASPEEHDWVDLAAMPRFAHQDGAGKPQGKPQKQQKQPSKAGPEKKAAMAAGAAGKAPNATAAHGGERYNARCMHVPFALCVGNPLTGGTSVITGTQTPKGLVGRWDFDSVGGQDSSGVLSSMVPAPLPGPGFLGGSSGYLDGKRVPVVQHHPLYESDRFSVEFWLFLIRDSFGGFQTLFHKGRREGDVTVAAPGVQLWPDTRRLHVSVSTGPRHKVTVDSAGGVPLRRWTHVAVVVDGRIVQIFLNGILDTEYLMPGTLMPNEDPIYVGNDPWLGNGPVAYMDELRVYRRALTAEDVHAVGSNAFPGLNSRNVRLACGNCPLAEARVKCPESFHLCAREELFSTGALSIARTMGWVSNLADGETTLWEADQVPAEGTGLGLCCRDEASA